MRLILQDVEFGRDLERYLDLMEGQLKRAVIALNLRDLASASSRVDSATARQEHDEWNRRFVERMQARDHSPRTRDNMYDVSSDPDDVRLEMERERYARGELPKRYWKTLEVLMIEAFIFAMHTFRELLEDLREDLQRKAEENPALASPLAPSESAVTSVEAEFDARLPGITAVRDSLHHMEERGRGLAWGKPLNLPALDEHGSTILILGARNATGYEIVTATGESKRVDITAEIVMSAAGWLQLMIDSFRWDGWVQHKRL